MTWRMVRVGQHRARIASRLALSERTSLTRQRESTSFALGRTAPVAGTLRHVRNGSGADVRCQPEQRQQRVRKRTLAGRLGREAAVGQDWTLSTGPSCDAWRSSAPWSFADAPAAEVLRQLPTHCGHDAKSRQLASCAPEQTRRFATVCSREFARSTPSTMTFGFGAVRHAPYLSPAHAD